MPPDVSRSANSWNGRIRGRIGVSAIVLRLLGTLIRNPFSRSRTSNRVQFGDGAGWNYAGISFLGPLGEGPLSNLTDAQFATVLNAASNLGFLVTVSGTRELRYDIAAGLDNVQIELASNETVWALNVFTH